MTAGIEIRIIDERADTDGRLNDSNTELLATYHLVKAAAESIKRFINIEVPEELDWDVWDLYLDLDNVKDELYMLLTLDYDLIPENKPEEA